LSPLLRLALELVHRICSASVLTHHRPNAECARQQTCVIDDEGKGKGRECIGTPGGAPHRTDAAGAEDRRRHNGGGPFGARLGGRDGVKVTMEQARRRRGGRRRVLAPCFRGSDLGRRPRAATLAVATSYVATCRCRCGVVSGGDGAAARARARRWREPCEWEGIDFLRASAEIVRRRRSGARLPFLLDVSWTTGTSFWPGGAFVQGWFREAGRAKERAVVFARLGNDPLL
jgi:hypothetical protein